MKFMSRRPNWKRLANHRQCPASRSYNDKGSRSRLFAASDFSSHPYSVYYGTSGSTAQQNFGQNDDINDVYGYGPEDTELQERYDNHQHGSDRNLRSMQDIPLFDGRRGATVFGSRKYHGGGREFYRSDPRMADERDMMLRDDQYNSDGRDFYRTGPRMAVGHDMMLRDDRLMEDHHEMGQMDSLMHEREHLRRELDAVVSENIHLHNQKNVNGAGPQVLPPKEQNQRFVGLQSSPEPNPATNSAVASVMDELKNMRQTVQALEAQHHQGNSVDNSEMHPATTPSVEDMKSELRNMEKVLDNLEKERAQSSEFANGYDASTSKTSEIDLNGSGSAEEAEGMTNGSRIPDHAHQLFDGQYEVVIKAELKKKNGSEGMVEKQIDVNDSTRESPAASSFGNNYI